MPKINLKVFVYKRILLKLSGEALLGSLKSGIATDVCLKIAHSIKDLQNSGVQIGIVIGGGNIFRGLEGQNLGMQRVASDQIGMLATVINGMTLKEVLQSIGCKAKVLSSFSCGNFVELYNAEDAVRYLEEGYTLIFVGGTGNPYFTTDTASALRAIEIKADILLKATKVDGIYDKDPAKHNDALKLIKVSFAEILEKRLAVMDLTAATLCMENKLPLLVFDIFADNGLKRAVLQENIGTLVQN